MSQSPLVALACPHPYLVVACVLFWIYRNGTFPARPLIPPLGLSLSNNNQVGYY
jgi:hypothetical protein